MIHRIYSSLDTFKELEFHKGLNILSAVRTPTSSDRQTRNGAGKSSFVAIVNMLLGANLGRDSIFRHDALIDHWFGMDFDLRGSRTTVRRSGKPRSDIRIRSELDLATQYPPTFSFFQNDYQRVSQNKWKEILGQLIFDFPIDDEYEALGTFKPTFRSLFSYFAREHPDGFITYKKHFSRGSKYQYQVPLSYVLGIDWIISQELENLRKEERQNRVVKRKSNTEDHLPSIGSPGELRTRSVIVEERYKRLESNLKEFHVLPEYREYESEANKITVQLTDLSDQIMLDQRIIDDLQASMDAEQEPVFERLEELYAEANVILPKHVTSRYEDVRKFHASIVENRRLYLRGEIENASERIRQNKNQSEKLEKKYTEIMAILQPHGAIDQRVALETELHKLAGELAVIGQRLIEAESFENRKSELQLRRNNIERQLTVNLREQRADLDLAILSLEQVAQQLYETSGELIISPTDDGPEFQVKMRADKSKGITNMEIFAFDMMLMMVCTRRNISPGFLIHDSHLFDGVDTRQIQKALQVGADLAEEYGFQYIVTMNSDMEPEGFERYRIATVLTDATEDGGLFGFRFD